MHIVKTQLLPPLDYLKQDAVLANLIDTYGTLPTRDPAQIDLFADLIESIISQQLSVKVADIITARFILLLPNGSYEPHAIVSLDPEAVRRCGISYSKIRYIQGIAQAAVSGTVNFKILAELSDAEVIAELTKLHGVGQWTAEMLLIFSLQRPDVFSVGDLGLRTAISRLYGLDREDKAAISALASRWSPYRSLASRYLWKSLENASKG